MDYDFVEISAQELCLERAYGLLAKGARQRIGERVGTVSGPGTIVWVAGAQKAFVSDEGVYHPDLPKRYIVQLDGEDSLAIMVMQRHGSQWILSRS